jgi:hypothetical protein
MHKKVPVFLAFSAFSSAAKQLFCWENPLFSGIIKVSETGGKSSG